MSAAVLVIGALLILNGIFQTQHAVTAGRVARLAEEESRGEVICGSQNGLLAMSSCQIWSSVDKRGNLGTVRGIRSGIFRLAKQFELDLKDENIRTMKPEELDIPGYAAASLISVQKQYLQNCRKH